MQLLAIQIQVLSPFLSSNPFPQPTPPVIYWAWRHMLPHIPLGSLGCPGCVPSQLPVEIHSITADETKTPPNCAVLTDHTMSLVLLSPLISWEFYLSFPGSTGRLLAIDWALAWGEGLWTEHGQLHDMVCEMAAYGRQQRKKLTKVADNATRDSWISQVVMEQWCEERSDFRDNWREALGCFWGKASSSSVTVSLIAHNAKITQVTVSEIPNWTQVLKKKENTVWTGKNTLEARCSFGRRLRQTKEVQGLWKEGSRKRKRVHKCCDQCCMEEAAKQPSVWSLNHRITGCFGLEGKFRGHLAQSPCSKQGHLQLGQVAQSPVQPGLECF